MRLDIDEQNAQRLIDLLTTDNKRLFEENSVMKDALESNYDRLYHHIKKVLILKGVLRERK